MKLITVFLAGTTFSQFEVTVKRINGQVDYASATPGSCSIILGPPIRSVDIPRGLIAKFYTGFECDGEQAATGIEQKFRPTGDIFGIKSVRVGIKDQVNDDADYYNSNTVPSSSFLNSRTHDEQTYEDHLGSINNDYDDYYKAWANLHPKYSNSRTPEAKAAYYQ